jgi:iron complex outermembrane recepter protein
MRQPVLKLRAAQMPIPRFAKTSLAACVTLVCHGWVVAQTLPDVVISGSRAEQRSFDAPGAITGVDRSVIEGAGPQVNLSESLNRVPGLTILNRQNYAQDLQLSIRGFGARSAFGIRGIRLLIDGIPATTPDGQGQGSSVSLTSTERLEVLRGPLALMYGNSSGGVIQAFTRDAPATPELGAQVYAGSFGLRRADLQYAGRIGDYGLVADYSTLDTDGFRGNSKTERKQFNGKLSFGLGEQTKVNVVFNQFDMPLAQDPLGLTAAQLAANPTQAGTNAISRSVRKVVLQNQMGTSVVHTLDADRSLTARLYYGTRENLQYQTGLATATGGWVGLDRTYYGTGLQYNARTKIGTVPVSWVAGYEFDRSVETRQAGAAVRGEKTTTTRNEDNQAENSDFFAQATAGVTDALSVVAGLRYSRVRFGSNDNYLLDGNGSGTTRYKSTSPVLGLTWHATDSLNLYANYGRGFESPTLAEIAYSGTGAPAFNTALNASRSRHYELGAKWLASARSRLDVTVFQVDSTDEIVVASSTGGNSTFKNAPGTRRTGLELAGSTQFTPNLRATLSASRINANFSQTFTSGATTVKAGNKIPGIPQSFVFSELLWTARDAGTTVSRQASALGSQAGLEFTQAGRLYANDVNTASADGYATLAAKFSHGWAVGAAGSLTAYARIDNLTNERYTGSVIVNQAAAQFFEPAPGRNWTLGLRLVLPL